MLYCPKCSRTYEKGTQRFCDGDDSRLLPVRAAKPDAQARNVFANLLDKTLHSRETIGCPAAVLTAPPESVFETPRGESVFKPEGDAMIFKEAEKKAPKSIARLIKPFEIPVSQASLGNRAQNPSGRAALTWESPDVLLGHTIKGRYLIVEKSSEDETSIAYLAEDQIGGKKVSVRVLMDEDTADVASKILAEERVSLSHINHPNVAHLFDSGELPEGIPFIVSEFVAGDTLEDKIASTEQFNTQRAARIVQQAASALNQVHQNDILHRNLKPKNIVLSVSDSGVEQVKVTDFGVFDGFEEQNAENIAYLSPEQIAGKTPNFAGDIYALAVIAYQVLTGRLPFEFSTEDELLRAQKSGLSLLPTHLREDVAPHVDEILEKALSFNPAERYPKARDFGDAFYNALTTSAAPLKNPVERTEAVGEEFHAPAEAISPTEFDAENPVSLETDVPDVAEKTHPEQDIAGKIETVKATDDLAWEKRSPEPFKPVNGWRVGSIALGFLMLCAVVLGIWNYFWNRQPPMASVAPPTPVSSQSTNARIENGATAEKKLSPAEIESTPAASSAALAPPDSVYFQNSKNKLTGDLAKNFRGFSFYYPKDWVKNPSGTNFVDVARVGATGTPIEQMIVSNYESNGTFVADKKIFPRLVEKSSSDLKRELGRSYVLLSQGETKINDKWNAFEIKFQSSGVTKNGDKITLWGRRLWIPAARAGVKSGLVLTMLATSNSPEVKSADDVGVKGELASVLTTFETADTPAH